MRALHTLLVMIAVAAPASAQWVCGPNGCYRVGPTQVMAAPQFAAPAMTPMRSVLAARPRLFQRQAAASYGSAGGTVTMYQSSPVMQSYGSNGGYNSYSAPAVAPTARYGTTRIVPLARQCDNPACTCPNCTCGPNCDCGTEARAKLPKDVKLAKAPLPPPVKAPLPADDRRTLLAVR